MDLDLRFERDLEEKKTTLYHELEAVTVVRAGVLYKWTRYLPCVCLRFSMW